MKNKPTERVTIETSPISGVALIHEERMRQIHSEGWTPEHDDKHTNGELAFAGSAYASKAAAQSNVVSVDLTQPHHLWPWAPKWWKASPDPIRNLVKAGALIAAEIDRLQRQAKQAGKR